MAPRSSPTAMARPWARGSIATASGRAGPTAIAGVEPNRQHAAKHDRVPVDGGMDHKMSVGLGAQYKGVGIMVNYFPGQDGNQALGLGLVIPLGRRK